MSLTAQFDAIRRLADALGRPVRLMEVCGTHTMAAFRSGLRSRLPETVALLSGPGCPVCVTPTDYVDRAIALARRSQTTVATFGDLLRVPGTDSSLERERARGADVRVVYSPLDALALAERRPERRVVFLGVGFETTAPTVAWTIKAAAERGLRHYTVLCAHKTMPRAMAALLAGGEVRLDAFLCPGHVSVITGTHLYDFICRDYHTPCVVAGFEAPDLIRAIAMALRQCVEGRAEVETEYRRAVTPDGNPRAQALLAEVFEPCDVEWRGLGLIPGSGLRLRAAFREQDAEQMYDDLPPPAPPRPTACRCGAVLRGVLTPPECPLFRRACTPATPVGACMVSSEGACAAYYKYAAVGMGP